MQNEVVFHFGETHRLLRSAVYFFFYFFMFFGPYSMLIVHVLRAMGPSLGPAWFWHTPH